MILLDFLQEVYFIKYFISLILILLFLWYFNLKYKLLAIEPLNLVDLVFLQSALLLVYYKESPFIPLGIFIILFYLFTRFFSLYLSTKVNLSIPNSIVVPKSFISFINILYIIISIFIFMKFYSQHNQGNFKLIWNQDYKLLGFLYTFLSILAIFNLLYIKKFFNKKIKLFLIILTISTVIYSGIYFHSKGSLLILFFLFLIHVKIENKKFKAKYFLFLISIVFLVIIIGFGNNMILFFNRIIKNTDGTFILLQEHLYNMELFSHNFWIQIFKFITFKIGFQKQEIGEVIATYSKYYYVPHGGPNDNIISYLISNFSIFNVLFYIFFIMLFITIIHKNFNRIFYNYYLYQISIFFYIKAPGLIQAPSTTFLQMSKMLIIFLFFIMIYAIIPKKRISKII